jgi:hypothetical protein
MDWLIDYLRFYAPLKNISLIWRRHHCRWRAAKIRPMLGAQGLWAGGIFIVPHLLWHGTSVFPVSSEGPPHLVAFTTHEGMWRIYSNPDPHVGTFNGNVNILLRYIRISYIYTFITSASLVTRLTSVTTGTVDVITLLVLPTFSTCLITVWSVLVIVTLCCSRVQIQKKIHCYM